MPAKDHTASNSRQQVERSNRDSMRWTAGMVLLFVGLFVAVSVVSYYFTWQADYSLLLKTASDLPDWANSYTNLCGHAGAWIGEQIVGRAFGFFGLLVPAMLILAGVRIIRQRPLLINRSMLSLMLVMIFGSLTLGFLCGDRWSLCASSGWGGAFGIEMASRWPVGNPPHPGLLPGAIGPIGTLLLLAAGWILTGVFINRSFIDKVNSAGNAMIGGSERIVERVRETLRPEDPVQEDETGIAADEEEEPVPPTDPRLVAPPRPAEEQQPVPGPAERGAEEDEYPFREEPYRAGPPVRPAYRTQPDDEEEPFEVFDADPRPTVETVRPSEPAATDPDEIQVIDLGIPSGSDSRLVAPPPVADPEAGETGEEDELIVVDVSPRQGGAPQPELPVRPVQPAQPEQDGVVTIVEQPREAEAASRVLESGLYDPLKDLIHYRKPSTELLEDYVSDSVVTDEEIYDNKSRIEETLRNFGIPVARPIKATIGPTVTLYEIVQESGVKIAKIQGLQNDIAQSLKAESGIRIIAPMPGRGTIGIEVPNRDKQIVSMYSSVRSKRFQEMKAELPVVIGRTISEYFVFDLAKMPHLLVAGATGQGKSVGLNAIIMSLLYRKHPAQLKLVMIDPKMVEFSLYGKLERHFLAKMESEDDAIITDPKKAVYTLNSLCVEMDARLELCRQASVREIKEYNRKFTERRLNPEKGHRYLPYIVVVIDEFADLIMMAKEVEMPVIRLAQKARAVGIHLIIATQRPSVDVITGKIKANFPARIAFRVMQMIDSRTIIDRPGANELIGRGDMLISKDGELTRVQCALVDTPEVERIVDYISKQQGYTSAYALPDYVPDAGEGGGGGFGLGSEEGSGRVMKYDARFAEIARDAVSSGQISISSIQSDYEVGFARARRIMSQFETAGIVGRQVGAKPREILFHDLPSLEAKLQSLGLF